MLRSRFRARSFILVAAFALCSQAANAQIGEICREFGLAPNRDADENGRLARFVYGRIVLLGLEPGTKRPEVTVQYNDTGQPGIRQSIGRSGNYCFRRYGSGGTVIVEVEGFEAARRAISEGRGTQHREDLEIDLARMRRPLPPPGVVSVTKQPDSRTIKLYENAVGAENSGRTEKAIELINEIVSIDPTDHVAWAKLASLYQSKGRNTEAENAYRRTLQLREDYLPALMNFGILKAVRGDYPGAIELFRRATSTDPASARSFRLLGEAYLQNRQGTLGLEALDTAIGLDPVGMAECHLLKAKLFHLVGAKKRAADEYREFLKKVPTYEDKKALEVYINENGQ